MAKRFRSSIPTANQEIRPGIKVANGIFFVDEELEELFRRLPPIRRLFENGQIEEIKDEAASVDFDVAQPEINYLNLKEAAEIAEQYGWTKEQLATALKTGQIPGHEGKGKYRIVESDLVRYLMEHPRSASDDAPAGQAAGEVEEE